MLPSVLPCARPVSLLLLLGSSLASQEVRGWNRKLSAPLGSGGSVGTFEVRAGWVVYAADQDVDERYELFGVPIDGHLPAARLNGPLAADQDVGGARLTGDGAQVVFRVAVNGQGRELYRSATDGSQLPVLLAGPLSANRQLWDVRLAPDEARVVYSDLELPSTYRVSSVPLAGGPPVELGTGLYFACTPDSTRVVMSTPLAVVPIDGSAAPLVLDGNVGELALSPDSLFVVYRSGADIHSARLDGSTPPVRLNDLAVAGGSVQEFQLTPDGARVVYRQDLLTDQRFLLLAVPLERSLAPVLLNGPLVAGGDVHEFLLSPLGPRAVYRADQEVNDRFKVYGVLVDGSAPEVAVSPAPTGVDFGLSPDGSRAWYAAAAALAVAPVEGGGTPVSIGLGLGPLWSSTRFASDGESLLYLVRRLPSDPTQLYRQYANEQHEAVLLHPPFPAGRDVREFRCDRQRVVYAADQDTDGVVELYSTKLLPRARASAPTETVTRTH